VRILASDGLPTADPPPADDGVAVPVTSTATAPPPQTSRGQREREALISRAYPRTVTTIDVTIVPVKFWRYALADEPIPADARPRMTPARPAASRRQALFPSPARRVGGHGRNSRAYVFGPVSSQF
jgi:hypothetical protein